MKSMSTTSDQNNAAHATLLNNTVLHENDLIKKAKSQFSYHKDVLNTFESYRQCVLHNELITDVGRKFFLSELHNLHTNFKRVLNYAAEHNKFRDQNLPTIGPLIICGIARTGTTLLYNLLACDPNCRAPLFTDMMIDVVPPIARSDSIEQKRRIDILNSPSQETEQLTSNFIQIAACHPYFPNEEDCHILRQAGCFPLFTLISDNENSNAESWIRNEMNKGYAYDYHETFVRMLNSVDAPKSHWLLKTPYHAFYLDELLRHYPNALLIMTHRSLDEVLPSWCSLASVAANGHFDAMNSISRDRITKRCYQSMDKSIECIMKFRTCQNGGVDQSRKNMFDITYDNVMKNPIGVVHQIYDYFNLQWSNEFEIAMNNWLLENPQGKHSRHKYTLSKFGFNQEDIQARYADYTKVFLSSTFSHNQSSSTN
ncbi:unnamed protein product [Rotaria sp. Silwood1]|nr:unnamed protein product [Rotaria sp. Silwood1]